MNFTEKTFQDFCLDNEIDIDAYANYYASEAPNTMLISTLWERISISSRNFLESNFEHSKLKIQNWPRQTICCRITGHSYYKTIGKIIQYFMNELNVEISFLESLPELGKTKILNHLTKYGKEKFVNIYEHPMFKYSYDKNNQNDLLSNRFLTMHRKYIEEIFESKDLAVKMIVERDMDPILNHERYQSTPYLPFKWISPVIQEATSMYVYLACPISDIRCHYMNHKNAKNLQFLQDMENILEEKWYKRRQYDYMLRVDIKHIDYVFMTLTISLEKGDKFSANLKETINKLRIASEEKVQ